MRAPTLSLCLIALLTASPLAAQEAVADVDTSAVGQVAFGAAEEVGWQTVWGVAGLRAMPVGLKVAPDGGEYHPNFSLDLNINGWLWQKRGLYLFCDARLWGQRSEYGVTNARDSWYGTSKRQFDLSGGAAWNYAGAWEARAFGYTSNNLNRGDSHVNPSGFTDGFGLENRYYLSPEYAALGQSGFDVTRATFLSIGYYPSREIVGNDGDTFAPGLLLRAYLIQDLWDWPCYLFGDLQYISERSFQPRLLLFDVGLAVRPFHSYRQWELRLGSENTADVKVHNDFSIGYVAMRYIY